MKKVLKAIKISAILLAILTVVFTFGSCAKSLSDKFGFTLPSWFPSWGIFNIFKKKGNTEYNPDKDGDIDAGDNNRDPEKPKSFTISFHANGGVFSVNNTNKFTVKTGSDYKLAALPETPVQQGYNFYFWSLARDSVAPGMIVTTNTIFTEDTTVYALWSGAYTITFDPNGGSINGAQTLTTNTNGLLDEYPSDPSLTNRTFIAWNKREGDYVSRVGTNTVYFCNTTLYAEWSTSCKVIFDSNGGTPNNQQELQTREDGVLNSFPAPPTKTGYNFSAWGLVSDPDRMLLSTPIDGNHFFASKFGQSVTYTLYAHYTKEFDIQFVSENESGITSSIIKTDMDGLLTERPVTPKREGYVFIGWSTREDVNIFVKLNSVFYSDTTLYARFIDENDYNGDGDDDKNNNGDNNGDNSGGGDNNGGDDGDNNGDDNGGDDDNSDLTPESAISYFGFKPNGGMVSGGVDHEEIEETQIVLVDEWLDGMAYSGYGSKGNDELAFITALSGREINIVFLVKDELLYNMGYFDIQATDWDYALIDGAYVNYPREISFSFELNETFDIYSVVDVLFSSNYFTKSAVNFTVDIVDSTHVNGSFEITDSNFLFAPFEMGYYILINIDLFKPINILADYDIKVWNEHDGDMPATSYLKDFTLQNIVIKDDEFTAYFTVYCSPAYYITIIHFGPNEANWYLSDRETFDPQHPFGGLYSVTCPLEDLDGFLYSTSVEDTRVFLSKFLYSEEYWQLKNACTSIELRFAGDFNLDYIVCISDDGIATVYMFPYENAQTSFYIENIVFYLYENWGESSTHSEWNSSGSSDCYTLYALRFKWDTDTDKLLYIELWGSECEK